MAENDIFSPPTAEEMALFAPPKDEELQQYKQESDDPGALAAAGLGLAQGGTLGFADEIEGGIRAAYNASTDNKEKKSLMELYRQYRDIARERYQKAQEAHPIAYTAGELSSVALPGGGGIGLLSKGLRGVGAISKTSKGLNLARRMYEGGKEGLILGGVGGAGTSQADLTQPSATELQQFVSDVGSGMKTGGAVGTLLPAAGAAIKGTSGAISDSQYAQQLKRVYDRALQGKKTAGIAGAEETAQEALQTTKELQSSVRGKIQDYTNRAIEEYKSNPNIRFNAEEFQKHLINRAKEMAKESALDPDETKKVIGTIKNQFTQEKEKLIKAGKTLLRKEAGPVSEGAITEPTITEGTSIKELPEGFRESPEKITQFEKTISKPSATEEGLSTFKEIGTKNTIDYIKDAVMKGELTSEEVDKIVRNLRSAGKFDAATATKVTNLLKRISGEASDVLKEKVPTIRPIKAKQEQLYGAEELLGAKGESTRMVDAAIEDLSTLPTTKEAFQKATTKVPMTEEAYLNFIRKMSNKNEPIQKETEQLIKQKLAQGLGKEKTEQLWSKMAESSKDLAISKASQKDIQSFASLMAAPKAMTYHIPEMAGSAVKSAKDFSKDILSLVPERAQAIAEKLIQKGTPASQRTAEMLQKLTKEAGPQANNALLFTLAQNPLYRKEIAEASGTQLESEGSQETTK